MMDKAERRKLFEDWLLQCPVEYTWQGYGKKLKGQGFQLEQDKGTEVYAFYPLPEESEDEEL